MLGNDDSDEDFNFDLDEVKVSVYAYKSTFSLIVTLLHSGCKISNSTECQRNSCIQSQG